MDTSNDAADTREVPVPDEETGWDAHQVWRDRVREARREKRPPPQTLAEGWDPLQTWHDRVLRPRKG